MKTRHALLTIAATAGAVTLGAFATEATIRFASPERLWWSVIPILLVALYTAYWLWRSQLTASLGDRELVGSMTDTFSPQRHVASFVLVAIASLLLVGASARPQWGERPREVERRGIDVVFVVDVSRSMLTDDVAPSRLDATVSEIDQLLRRLAGDRVGLVVFAGIAFAQTPLTSDYGAIRLYLDRLNPEQLPIQGTAIQLAIDEAESLLLGGDNPDFHRAETQLIVVISDGEDHTGTPVESARRARENGIQVLTVGVGTEQGGRIPVHDPRTGAVSSFRDREGNVVHSSLNEDQLIAIADAAGGDYLRYTGEGSVARFIEDAIDAYEDEVLASLLREEYVDRYHFFVIPALALLVLASLLGHRRRSRLGAALVTGLVLIGLSGCGDSLLREDPTVREAIALSEAGDHEAAATRIDEAPEEALEMPAYHYDRGLILDRGERYDAAQSAYLDSIATAENALLDRALVGLGNSLFHSEDYAEAIERYRRALLLDADNEPARHNLELALRQLFPVCATLEDTLEPNDNPENAAPIPETVLSGTYAPPTPEDEEPPEMVACPGNADWYAIPVLGGDTITVQARFNQLRDDTGGPVLPREVPPTSVRLNLLAPDGETPLAVDQGLAGGEEAVRGARLSREILEVPIDPAFAEAGFVLLQIETDGPIEYDYTLEVELVPPCWALEDDFEDNDTREAATQLETQPYQGRLCEGDDDWYSRRLEIGESLFVDLSALMGDDEATYPLEARLYVNGESDPTEVRIVDEEQPGTTFSFIEVTEPTEVAVELVAVDGLEGGYMLNGSFFPPCAEGGDDAHEDNDGPHQPAALNTDEQPFLHLRLCEGDEDWFAVQIPPQEPEESDDPEAEPAEPEPQAFSALATYAEPERFVQVDLYQPQGMTHLAHGQPPFEDPRLPALPTVPGGAGVTTPGGATPSGPSHRAQPGGGAVVPTIVPPGPGGAPDPNGIPEVSAIPPEWLEGPVGVIAATVLEPDATQVIVRVEGEPGFYDLSFPDTQAQNQQPQSSDNADQSDEEQDPQDGDNAEDGEEGEQDSSADAEDGEDASQDAEDGEEGDDQEQANADEADEDGEDEAAAPSEDEGDESSEDAYGDEMTDEERERAMLMNLLNSLESDEVNLPLQQALENAPPRRHAEEW